MRKRSCPAVSHCKAHLRQSLLSHVRSRLSLCGCTHDLKFYGLAIELDGPDLEVDADCGDVALGVGIIRETEQKA